MERKLSHRPRVRVLTENELARRMTPEDVENAELLIAYLADKSDLMTTDAVELLEKAKSTTELLREKSEILEQRRLSRRNFLVRAVKFTTFVSLVLGLPSYGMYWIYDNTAGSSAQQRRQEEIKAAHEADVNKRRVLEEKNTLGTESSVRSFSGWSVRYAKKDQTEYTPTNVVSTPLDPHSLILLPGEKLNELENTGIFIEEHIRTSDQIPVGRLAIATKYFPATVRQTSSSTTESVPERYEIGEELVLRDESTPEINSKIIVIEKHLLGKSLYLQLTRSRSVTGNNPTFQLRVMDIKR